jgi:hypothetical protein
VQPLPNIGTVAGNSVQPLGTGLDVLFLSDTGVRSLRVRDLTLSAGVADIGSPVDSQIRKALLAGNGPSAASGVEPLTGAYMVYVNPSVVAYPNAKANAAQCLSSIYSLAYYPSNKIIAWSTLDAVDNLGGYFIPSSRFQTLFGQLWIYGMDAAGAPALYQYGGPNNDTYDASVCTVILPFMDAKAPGISKVSLGFDAVINSEYPSMLDVNNKEYAAWSLYASMDPQNVDSNNVPQGWTAQPIYTGVKPTYDLDKIPYNERGTHVSIKFVSSGVGPASLSSITWHYNVANEK